MHEYLLSIFVKMSYITLYFSNSRHILVPVPGNYDLNSVVYGGLKMHHSTLSKLTILQRSDTQPSEILAYLGITRAQIRAPYNPSNNIAV